MGFGGIAGAVARAGRTRDEIERQRMQDQQSQEMAEIQKMALMSGLAAQGVSPERETIKSELPGIGALGNSAPRRPSTPVDTGIVDPSRYQSVGKVGGKEYYRDRAQQIAAQRQAERAARIDEALKMSQTDENAAQAAKLRRVDPPDEVNWNLVEGKEGYRQIHPRTGQVRPVQGVTPREPASNGYRDMSAASTLRGQFNGEKAVKDAADIASAYQRIRAVAQSPSAAGDLSLIFGYMKMLDPGSTVREGEFANAQNAAGVPDQVRNMYERVRSGQRLNPNQRQDFLNQAENIAKGQRQAVSGVMRRYVEIANRNGMNPRDIVFDPFEGGREELPFKSYP